MHFSMMLSWLCLLLATSALAGGARDARKREGATSLANRSVQVGWSLQSQSCPANSNSCGGNACCPSSLFCNPPGNAQSAACCPTSSDCRGDADSSGRCADSSWSLWQGRDGNLFCCEVGLVGIYDYRLPRAGTCVSSGAAAGATTAVIKSTGSGGTAPTTSPPSTTPTTTPSMPGATGKPVFFHYMIGTVSDAHCEKDILDAKALGADAFALNINTVTASWATGTTALLFKWAAAHDFKLFFSFDMTGFNNPNQFISFLQGYVTNSAYYRYKGLPFVSTFNGGASQFTFGQGSVNDGWKVALQQAMANSGNSIYFVPSFQDVPASTNFFSSQFPTVDGAFNWNSWAFESQGKIVVPTTDDVTYLNGARAAGKTFMMGVSPLQFKHMDSGNNWYLRGEQNLEYRFGQVLSLQPDFVEVQTWNDAGESHYMGNSWPEPIDGSNIGTYTNAYDHTAYKEILPAFIKAYKAGVTNTNTMYPTNGKNAQGTFWHHTLLANANCGGDSFGKPRGANNIEDLVAGVVLLAPGVTSYTVNVSVGGRSLGSKQLVPGFNSFSYGGLGEGSVTVTITNGGSTVASGTGPISVTNNANLCNYNFQVVGLA